MRNINCCRLRYPPWRMVCAPLLSYFLSRIDTGSLPVKSIRTVVPYRKNIISLHCGATASHFCILTMNICTDKRQNYPAILSQGNWNFSTLLAGLCVSMSASAAHTMLTLTETRWICMCLRLRKPGLRPCTWWGWWTISAHPKTAKYSLQPPRQGIRSLPHELQVSIRLSFFWPAPCIVCLTVWNGNQSPSKAAGIFLSSFLCSRSEDPEFYLTFSILATN